MGILGESGRVDDRLKQGFDPDAGYAPAPRPPVRRRVSVLGIALRLVVAIAILAGAGWYALSLIADRPEPPARQARERSFTVSVAEAERGTFRPLVGAFGQIVAARTIDIRAEVGGQVVDIHPALRDGGSIDAGEMLLSIDPFAHEGALADAEGALGDARLSLAEAEEQARINAVNVEVAAEQLELGQRDLDRARTLFERGSLTGQELESRELLVSQRRQALNQAESALLLQEAAIARQTAAISRAEWSVEQAQRALDATVITAPFDAVVTETAASLGRVFTQNEVVATLYDANALEVRFTLSDREYGQLSARGLVGRPLVARWDIAPAPVELAGTITRAGAQVDATLGGVQMYARLDPGGAALIRPGTFVRVEFEGLEYENALRLPETAVYEGDHFYVVEDRRMARRDAEILARDGAHLILAADLSADERVVTTRLAQAGEGVLVAIEGEDEPQTTFGGGGPMMRPGGGG